MFELTDHLGNVRSVIAKNVSSNAVEVLSYSDYYPHGGVLPGRNYVSSPSYKFNGVQGKDAETNFTNFELRQLDPRLGRWMNPDPMGQYYSPYLAMGNNPVSMTDPSGGYSVGGGAFGFEDGISANPENTIAGMEYYGDFSPGSFNRLNPQDRQHVMDAMGVSNKTTDQRQIIEMCDIFGSFDSQGTHYYYNVNKDEYGSWRKFSYTEGTIGSFTGSSGNGSFSRNFGFNALIGESWSHIGTSATERALRRSALAYNEYGGDGSGSLKDKTQWFLNELEKYNPVSQGWDALSILCFGTDKYGRTRSRTNGDLTYAALGAIPFGNVEANVGKQIASEGSTTLYRAVSQGELNDIAANGLRPGVGGYSTGKLFATSAEDAAKFGRNNFKFDQLPNTIIKVTVPNSVMKNAYHFEADLMKAISIPADNLKILKAVPLNYSPF